MKFFLFFCLAIGLYGCGSISTLPKSDAEVRDALAKHDTRCEFLPYIYSGVAYNFCLLNADYSRNPSPSLAPQFNPSTLSLQFTLLDMLLSGVVDTAALPFTLPKQLEDGPLVLQ